MKYLLSLIFAVIPFVSLAQQPNIRQVNVPILCQPIERVNEILSLPNINEKLIMSGVDILHGDDLQMFVSANLKENTYTFAIITPDGLACVFSAGTNLKIHKIENKI
jgi:hypothetical protein